MDLSEVVNLIAAVLVSAPLAILIAQLLKRASWADGTKSLLAFVVCVLVGIAQTWIAGDLLGLVDSWGSLSSTQVIAWAGAVYVASQLEYKAFFAEFPWMLKLESWPLKEP